jgi:3-phosphoshikimate 1-carboxyvinyltransferase
MSFTLASLRAQAPIQVLDVAQVDTSFPGFAARASAIGLQIRVEESAT